VMPAMRGWIRMKMTRRMAHTTSNQKAGSEEGLLVLHPHAGRGDGRL
jgi:hypothetical protein